MRRQQKLVSAGQPLWRGRSLSTGRIRVEAVHRFSYGILIRNRARAQNHTNDAGYIRPASMRIDFYRGAVCDAAHRHAVVNKGVTVGVSDTCALRRKNTGKARNVVARAQS